MRWKAITFLWSALWLALFCSNSFAQTQQEALGDCLAEAAASEGQYVLSGICLRVNGQCILGPKTYATGHEIAEHEFRLIWDIIQNPDDHRNCSAVGGPDQTGLAVGPTFGFSSCEADRDGDYSSDSDQTGSTACVDGCEVVTSACGGFGDSWFCTGTTNGNMCSGNAQTDQCDREPNRPECVCSVDGGAASPTCMCQEDPLIFGDVSVCDDLLASGGGEDPIDTDGDGNPDDTDPCPNDASNSCGDDDGSRDSDNDGQNDQDDPCPFDASNTCNEDNPNDPNDPGGGGGGGDDGGGDGEEPPSGDPTGDEDGDGIANGIDPCPLDASQSCESCNPETEFCPDIEYPDFDCELDFTASDQFQFCPVDMGRADCQQWLIENYFYCVHGPGANDISAGDFDNDVETVDEFEPFESPEDLELGDLDESGFLSSDCPSFSFSILGGSLPLEMGPICTLLSNLGYLVLALSYYVAARILWGSF